MSSSHGPLLSLVLLLAACPSTTDGPQRAEGSTGSTGPDGTTDSGVGETVAVDESGTTASEQDYMVSGVSQKGPFVNGSQASIQELDPTTFAPTGNTFDTETTNDFGAFAINSTLASPIAEVRIDGFYFDEVGGALSSAPIVLRALEDLTVNSEVNVNLLTHLESNRLRDLVLSGVSFADARTQAQTEVLAVFGISHDPALSSFAEMDISQPGDSNAILLAVSAVLQQTAILRNPRAVEGELSSLLAAMITDLEDGVLDSKTVAQELVEASTSLDLDAVRSNLETRLDMLGMPVSVANFEDYIDHDGDGLLDGVDDNEPDPFTFPPVVDADPLEDYLSPAISIQGLSDDGHSLVSLTANFEPSEDAPQWVGSVELLKNGASTQTPTTVVNGDSLQLRLSTGYEFDRENTAALTIGDVQQEFTVTTRSYGALLPEGSVAEPKFVIDQAAAFTFEGYLGSVDGGSSYYEAQDLEGGWNVYLRDLSDDVDLYVYQDPGFAAKSLICGSAEPGTANEYCPLDMLTSSTLYIEVRAAAGNAAGATFTLAAEP